MVQSPDAGSEYGHAYKNLQTVASLANGLSDEKHKQEDVKALLDSHGKKIIPFLRPDLQEAAQALIDTSET